MHIVVNSHVGHAHPLNQHPGHLCGQRLHLPHEYVPLCELTPAPVITPLQANHPKSVLCCCHVRSFIILHGTPKGLGTVSSGPSILPQNQDDRTPITLCYTTEGRENRRARIYAHSKLHVFFSLEED